VLKSKLTGTGEKWNKQRRIELCYTDRAKDGGSQKLQISTG
jgi:hypothetical protein